MGLCTHTPACPPANHPAHAAAAPVALHPEQGWTLLCNGVVVFDDMGELVPGAAAPVAAHRPDPAHGPVRGSVTVQVAGYGPLLMARGPSWHTLPAAHRARIGKTAAEGAALAYALGYRW